MLTVGAIYPMVTTHERIHHLIAQGKCTRGDFRRAFREGETLRTFRTYGPWSNYPGNHCVTDNRTEKRGLWIPGTKSIRRMVGSWLLEVWIRNARRWIRHGVRSASAPLQLARMRSKPNIVSLAPADGRGGGKRTTFLCNTRRCAFACLRVWLCARSPTSCGGDIACSGHERRMSTEPAARRETGPTLDAGPLLVATMRMWNVSGISGRERLLYLLSSTYMRNREIASFKYQTHCGR